MILFSNIFKNISQSTSFATNAITRKQAYIGPCNKLHQTAYFFCTQNLITNLREVQEGRKAYQQRNIDKAQEMYQRALNILPFFIQNNNTFNQQFSELIDQIITIHVWKGNLKNVQNIVNKYQEQAQKNNVVWSEKLTNTKLLLTLLGKADAPLNQSLQIIADRIRIAKQYQKQQKYQIQKELTSQLKDKQPNSQNIQPWIHFQLKQTWLFILSSLLSRSNLSTNSNYNKVCNTLLKNTERSSPKNVIKPLMIISSNLLRNTQYLQAEGILSYALDRKRENIRPQLLKCNQEYIVLQLLLGRTLAGVQRKTEAQKLFDQYRPRFNLQLFLMQGFLLDSI